MTLQGIIEGAPRWSGRDRRTVRQFFLAVLSMLAVAVLFGAAGGLVLYWLLITALAHLS